MKVRYSALFLAAVFLFSPFIVYSENQQGTGLNAQVTVTSDERLLLQVSNNESFLVGAASNEIDYSELVLDQLTKEGQLYPNWGRAEVLLGCYQADVLLYQQQPTGWVEVAAMQVATDYCPTDQ